MLKSHRMLVHMPKSKTLRKKKSLAVRRAEKAKEFTEKNSEIYHGNKPEDAEEHH